MNRKLLCTGVLVFAALPAWAQLRDNQTASLNCDQAGNDGHLINHCEMREQTIPAVSRLTIDGRTNGGIRVKGWSRKEILVRAQVQTAAPTEAEARSLASQVFVQTAAGRIAADGPNVDNERRWSVSYEVFVPQQSDLSLATHNGGIGVSDVQGQIEFEARNGGIHLTRLAGDVKGKTTNGGVHIELAGDRWNGQGLDVRSVNGGVHLTLPANYSARLEGATTNGGVHSDVPGLATTNEKRPKEIGIDLGGGGAKVRVVTTNGSIHINRA
jgi:DUF4097 and DUF4098 domain-containing protein YvlB